MSSNILDFSRAPTQDAALAAIRSDVDADDVKQRITARAPDFVRWLFGGRCYIARGEGRIGDVQGNKGSSLSIQLQGEKAGLWFDHATGQRGDLFDLYMEHWGYDRAKHFRRAITEIAAEFLGDRVAIEREQWAPTVAARIHEEQKKLGDKPHKEYELLGAPVATWKYFDLRGNKIAAVERYEPDGTPASKTYLPFGYKNINGTQVWGAGVPDGPRPLYGQPEIAQASTVVLCEGEKCADALTALGIPATTAMSGAEAPIDRTDWSPLTDKTVVVWPDNDGPGLAYAEKVAKHLKARGLGVKVVLIPDGKPPKWDAADAVLDGTDVRALVAAAVDLGTEPRTSKFKLLDLDALEAMGPPEWLIDKVITEHGLSMIWGRSGSFKSFVALDMALAIATPAATWHQKAVKHGLVVYVAAEGGLGMARRIRGWMQTHGKDLKRPNLVVLPHTLTLASEDTDQLLAAIRDTGKGDPALVVLDTVARTFGTGDENKTADMNAYVMAADKVRNGTGAHVMVVHHSGKDEERGERGNLALRGAADTVIAVKRHGDTVLLINEAPKGKQKDAEEFPTIKLEAKTTKVKQGTGEHPTLYLRVAVDPIAGLTKDEEEPQRVGRRPVVQEAILTYLTTSRGKEFTCSEIVGGVEKDESSVRKALAKLVEEGAVERAGHKFLVP